ncbi:MAG: transposase [Planctomycetaceae bacterium]|nr:transposase [Planctomycetaceae bacterium]
MKLLQEGEAMLSAGKTLGEVLQKLEVKESTWVRWQKQYGGMKSDEAKRLKELELENRRLKELLAESELDKRILKEALERNYYARPEDVMPSRMFSRRVRCRSIGLVRFLVNLGARKDMSPR